MSFYSKNIKCVEFYGVKYRKINNINDSNMLKKEVEDILVNGNREQFLIDAENMKNKTLEEKDISMNINFSLVCSFVFGIISLVFGFLFGKVQNIASFYIAYIAAISANMIVIWLLVTRTREIFKLMNDKILFYETVCKIIENNNNNRKM